MKGIILSKDLCYRSGVHDAACMTVGAASNRRVPALLLLLLQLVDDVAWCHAHHLINQWHAVVRCE